MPIYQYRNLRTGQIEEHFRSIERRDCVEPHLKRLSVPEHLVVFGTSSDRLDPTTADAKVPIAFKQLEQQGTNWRKIEKESGFKRDHIRRTWNF